MAPLWAPGGTIRLAGEGTVRSSLVPAGDLAVADVLGAFTEVFTWHQVERLTTIVEGTRAAVRSRVRLSHGGGKPVDTEMMDDWRFDEDGRAVALVEFIDTAMLAPLLDRAGA